MSESIDVPYKHHKCSVTTTISKHLIPLGHLYSVNLLHKAVSTHYMISKLAITHTDIFVGSMVMSFVVSLKPAF